MPGISGKRTLARVHPRIEKAAAAIPTTPYRTRLPTTIASQTIRCDALGGLSVQIGTPGWPSSPNAWLRSSHARGWNAILAWARVGPVPRRFDGLPGLRTFFEISGDGSIDLTHRVSRKLVHIRPTQIRMLEGRGLAAVPGADKGMSCDLKMSVTMTVDPKRKGILDPHSQLTQHLSTKGDFEVLVVGRVASGEFPEASEQTTQTAPSDQNTPLAWEDATHTPHRRQPSARAPDRAVHLRSGGLGPAESRDRARVTCRPAGEADRRTQIHQGLVERRGAPFGQETGGIAQQSGLTLDAAWGEIKVHQPSQHPAPIAVERDYLRPKGDRPYRSRSVLSNSRQISQVFRVLRKLPRMLAQDLLCSQVHVVRAPVIAQPFPGRHQLVRRCLGQRLRIGKPRHPFPVIREDRLHPGLLKHDFGHPDGIWIARPPPGQVASVVAVPIQQSVSQGRGHSGIVPAAREMGQGYNPPSSAGIGQTRPPARSLTYSRSHGWDDCDDL